MLKSLIRLSESIIVVCAFFLVTSLLTPPSFAASTQSQSSLATIENIPHSDSYSSPPPPFTIKSLSLGRATIELDGQSVTSTFDPSSGFFQVTYSDGAEALFTSPSGFSAMSIEPLSSAQLMSLKNAALPSLLTYSHSDTPRPPMLAASNSSVLCSYAVWVVSLIHHAGWSAALAAALAAGAAGAAVVAFIYAYGFDALMVWVSTKC